MTTLDREKLLDDVGRRILQELQMDARISYAELGRRIGLTLPAVAERVRKLEEAGIIVGYRAELNLEKIGFPITAFIRVATPNEILGGQLTATARSLPEVLELHRTTGGDSYLLKVAVASVQHLEKLIRKITLFGQPTTSIVLSSPIEHRSVTIQSHSHPQDAINNSEGESPHS
ncbi:MAG: Lrp/AsnC family transcriptional regulator [Chloroflexota bacterium]|jgi:Lrp/AsnC family leucine-responsive transcriptional regulator